jgi:hypothetical protein
MEYPGAKFTRPIRRALLIFFITLFFVITPIVIAFTIGYRYDWQNGFWKATGAISIDVEPTQTVTSLNGLESKTQMPVRLKNISQGKYDVRLSATDYYDWNKTIEVKDKETTYIKEISLLKKNSPQAILKNSINDFALSPDFRYIIFTEKENASNTKKTSIMLWDSQTEQTSQLFIADTGENLNIIWSPKNNCATIGDTLDEHKKLWIYCLPNKLIDLVSIETSPIEKTLWNTATQPELFYNTKNQIFSFIPQTQQKRIIVPNTYLDWYMADGQLWTLQKNTTTNQYKIIKDVLGFKTDFANIETKISNVKWEILTILSDAVLIKKKTTKEMILVNQNKQSNINGDKFYISPYNNWLLIWTPWELWTYTNGEEPFLLNRSGENLQAVVPLDKYNTIAMIYQNKITAIFPYYLTTNELLKTKTDNVSADSKNKILYYTIKDKSGLWMLKY